MIAWGTNPDNLTTSSTRSTYFSVTNLSPYTDYNFAICAKTEIGFGDWTELLKVKTGIGGKNCVLSCILDFRFSIFSPNLYNTLIALSFSSE